MPDSAQKFHSGSVIRATYATGRFGGTLVSDWTRGVPCAMNFFPARTWREVCSEIDSKQYPRAELSQALEASGLALGAPEESLSGARLLAEKNTYAVLTGQQAGFCGGPLLTIYKALTAVKLSRKYEREAAGAARFVPVFWVAGDDHDLGEINHGYFLKDDGTAARVTAPTAKEAEGRSACAAHLLDDAEALGRVRGELEALIGAEQSAELLREYESKDFEKAFASILLKWLGRTGLVVACSSSLRKFSGEMLAKNLDDFDVVSRLVQEAGVAMKKCMYEPGFSEQLRIAPHFFMALGQNKTRTAIQVESANGGRSFRLGGVEFSRAELLAKIKSEPELFSSSAVLRPVFQDSLFPTAAVVLGPGEIAYWAQLRKAHEHYGAPWPVIVPRASLTLIDALGEKAIRKLGMDDAPFDIFLEKDELTRRITAGGELSKKVNSRKAAIDAEFDALKSEVQAIDGGLGSMLEKIREKIDYELTRFAERAGSEMDKRGEAKTARAAYLSGLVLPRNAPQERTLCAAQFIARYPTLVERLLEIIEPDEHAHLIFTL